MEESCILVEDPSAAKSRRTKHRESYGRRRPESGTPISYCCSDENQRMTVRCTPDPAMDMDTLLKAIARSSVTVEGEEEEQFVVGGKAYCGGGGGGKSECFACRYKPLFGGGGGSSGGSGGGGGGGLPFNST
ncbi:homeobox protein Hox-B3-like [Nilaparvata lugens]|uniref:homeobox protein Hox-B3-like n=1 Tax=Nilaparvata lugens TaxID=108931 RepID=UPI00193CC66C|nr:homeobox protein Hox-B3-like [Nilaparvata lugens]